MPTESKSASDTRHLSSGQPNPSSNPDTDPYSDMPSLIDVPYTCVCVRHDIWKTARTVDYFEYETVD